MSVGTSLVILLACVGLACDFRNVFRQFHRNLMIVFCEDALINEKISVDFGEKIIKILPLRPFFQKSGIYGTKYT